MKVEKTAVTVALRKWKDEGVFLIKGELADVVVAKYSYWLHETTDGAASAWLFLEKDCERSFSKPAWEEGGRLLLSLQQQLRIKEDLLETADLLPRNCMAQELPGIMAGWDEER